MIVPITSLVLFILFCSFVVCLPISWIANLYFLNHFVPKFSVEQTSILFVFIGVILGLLIAFFKDWLNIILGIFSQGVETTNKRQVAFFNLFAIILMTVTAFIVATFIKYIYVNYLSPQLFILILLIGLLISYILIRAIISFGTKKNTEIYKVKYTAFIIVGIFLGIAIIPGVIAIIPVLAIFRAYGVSLYQSIRFYFLCFTIILIFAVIQYGFKIEIDAMLTYNVFALIATTALTITTVKWFHIFASDSIKVFKFFKWLLFFQIWIVILWFL